MTSDGAHRRPGGSDYGNAAEYRTVTDDVGYAFALIGFVADYLTTASPFSNTLT